MLNTSVPDHLGPHSDLYADVVREESTPAKETYNRLHETERHLRENPCGMVSASAPVDLMLPSPVLKRPLPDSPKQAPAARRSPNRDYEEIGPFNARRGSRP